MGYDPVNALIREHFAKETAQFARGDFSDLTYLHCEGMTGLSTLAEAATAGRLRVSYANLPDSAELTSAADGETVLTALRSSTPG